MKAMILAAGLGTRLLPLTLERAKPAMPLLGKPIVARLVERLVDEGVDGLRINLHHLPDTVKHIFHRPPWDGLPVSFSHEETILGTAGGVKANESFFDEGTFLMVNGKIVMDFPLQDAITFHRERSALATLILFPQPSPHRWFPVRIDKAGNLHNFKGSPPRKHLRPETYVFTGVHILEPEIFRFIPAGEFYEINDRVYPRVLEQGGTVLGFPVEGYWHEPSDAAKYLEVQRDLLVRFRTDPPVHIARTANVSPTARIGPFVSIGEDCVLEDRTYVENSILWEGVRLAPGASVRNSVLGSGVTIEGTCINRIVTLNGEASID